MTTTPTLFDQVGLLPQDVADPTPEPFALYQYQHDSIEALREGLRTGHSHQVLCAPTGSGKTVMAGALTKEALAKGSRVVFAVDRFALVWQTRDRFREMGIPVGVLQASNSYGRHERVQVVSIQTVESRGAWPPFDLLFMDECHEMRTGSTKLIKAVDKPVIGLSATPFTDGLADVYSRVVNVCTTDDLLEQINPASGRPYLAPLRVYACTEINMKGAKTNNRGEWQEREVERRGTVIVGDTVAEWVDKTNELFGGPVKTLVRSATIDHGAEICRAFQAAGFDFRQGHHRMSDRESKQLVEDFRAGKFIGLVSVSKYEKGFDVPDILCLIDQRPLRKSLAAEIQFLGRGQRAAPGKDYCLVLDGTGNFIGFQQRIYDFWENGVTHLSHEKHRDAVRREPKHREEIVCSCGFVLPPKASVCPACGKERVLRSGVEYRKGKLREVQREPGRAKWSMPKHETWANIYTLAYKWRNGNHEAASRFARKQYEVLFGEWPPRDWGHPLLPSVNDLVRRKVRQQLAAWAKSQS